MKSERKTRSRDVQMSIDGRAGLWSIQAWAAQYGCSVPHLYYGLKIRPHMARIGQKIRITESPHDYVERIRLMQEVDRSTKQEVSASAEQPAA